MCGTDAVDQRQLSAMFGVVPPLVAVPAGVPPMHPRLLHHWQASLAEVEPHFGTVNGTGDCEHFFF